MVLASDSNRRRSTRPKQTVRAVSLELSDSDSSEESSDDDATPTRTPAKRGKGKAAATSAKKRVKKATPRVANAVEEDGDEFNRAENYLYEAILDPEVSIDTLVNDFLDSYAEGATESMKDLINMILRSCGTKQEITTYDVEDTDTITETLVQLQDRLTGRDHDVVRTTADTYPLVSKNKTLKVFRKQLMDFWRTLVAHSADKQYLFDDEAGSLWTTIETWLSSLSSSSLRAFRHTTTAICLTIMTSMVDLTAKFENDISVAKKQLVAERNKTKPVVSKVKSIDRTIKEKSKQGEHLKITLENYFHAIFMHRHKDVDARIRSDNIKELGVWMMKLPSQFFTGANVSYFGLVLSDTNAATRIEAVKALTRLYSNDQYASGLRNFTERSKQRIIEMATEDSETSVRCAALGLVDQLRERGYLEVEDTELILSCIYDNDARVRAAATPTFHSILAERENDIIDEKLNGDVEDYGDLKSNWTHIKALVATLTTVSKALFEAQEADDETIDLAREQDALCSGRTRIAALSFLQGLRNVDFEAVSSYLLYDNGATIEPASAEGEELLKSVLCLSDNEESLLLEVLVATAEIASQGDKRTKNEDQELSVSVAIMNNLPLLMNKFKDSTKMMIILQLLSVCNLAVYTKYRKTALLEQLLQALTDTFIGHQEDMLLRSIGAALLLLLQENSLYNTTAEHLTELHGPIRKQFSSAETAEDTLLALRQLDIISSVHDCTKFIEDEAAGQSIFDKLKINLGATAPQVNALARTCLRTYFMWKLHRVLESPSDIDKEAIRVLIEKRDDVLATLNVLASDGNKDAAITVAEMQAMFASISEVAEAQGHDTATIRQPLDPDLQELIIAALQKEMKRYAKLNGRDLLFEGNVDSDDSDDDDDDEGQDKQDIRTQQVISERKICTVAGEIVAAIAAKKIDAKYVTLLLSNKGRLGHSYDAILKEIPAEHVTNRKTPNKSRRKATESARQVLASEANDDEE